MSEHLLEVKGLQKSFVTGTPVKDVHFHVDVGDIVALIGPSGAGKSTVLRCINCLENASAGEILLNGQNILAPDYDKNALRRRVGMVFQSFNLFNNMNVAENVMFGPMKVLGLTAEKAYEKAVEALASVGMSRKLLSYPDEISGGQKQRVAIARALAMEPELILLDEPTSALDPTNVGEVKSVINSLAKRRMTMIIVTHDMSFAKEIATKVLYLDEGVVYESGSPEEVFDDPEKELTRRFMRQLKALNWELVGKEPDFPELMSELEDFCGRMRLPLSQTYHLETAVEEICIEKILPTAPEDSRIELTVEYSERDKSASVSVCYNGEARDVFAETQEDDYSERMIRNAVTDIVYEKVNEGGFTNRYTMLIK